MYLQHRLFLAGGVTVHSTEYIFVYHLTFIHSTGLCLAQAMRENAHQIKGNR
jgi:hypothetical protein